MTDQLDDLLDRIQALQSEDVTYTTYSGREASMDGSVKFIYETEPVEIVVP